MVSFMGGDWSLMHQARHLAFTEALLNSFCCSFFNQYLVHLTFFFKSVLPWVHSKIEMWDVMWKRCAFKVLTPGVDKALCKDKEMFKESLFGNNIFPDMVITWGDRWIRNDQTNLFSWQIAQIIVQLDSTTWVVLRWLQSVGGPLCCSEEKVVNC